ncbi:SCO family protein [Puia sp. P3]|uniref:SCO family protein n=1 Tax=Puia sp. P3 TaxID=3423952 RepID=UPI003D66F664
MSKKALLAICIAVAIPLFFYMIARQYGVAMPGRYFPDSVVTKMQDGKEVTDTVWHKVANLTLQNQLGQTVSLDQLKGKVVIIDFFFTHCASICPILTTNMRHLQDGLKLRDNMKGIDTTFVQFLSLTVDPAHDSVPVIKKYADKYGINPDVWWLLTGPKRTIYDFALNELKTGAPGQRERRFQFCSYGLYCAAGQGQGHPRVLSWYGYRGGCTAGRRPGVHYAGEG